jgi:carboxypeptidase Q
MNLNKFLLLCLTILSFNYQTHAQMTDKDVLEVGEIFDNVLTEAQCYHWLHYLCKNVGHRIAGSPSGAAAVEYTRQMLDTMGCDKVWLQPVKVRYWTRGDVAECKIINSELIGTESLSVTALGYSAPTADIGMSGEIIEVKSLSELEKMDASKVKGKIVFFNGPMDPTKISTFHAYGAAGSQRTVGPRVASSKGAIGAIVRSLTLKADDIPHSGVTVFKDQTPIPAVGMGIQSSEKLSALLKKEPNVKVYLRLNCQDHGERETYNVIGEIKGSEKPDEIILVGGHLDSWDIGEGAHDDGAGCVHAMEVMHSFKRLGIKPKHTIRCVLFANEESGLAGALEYAKQAKAKGEKHLAAVESDGGGHTPRGFGMDAEPDLLKKSYKVAQEWREVLAPYGLYELTTGGSGADIGPLKSQGAVLFGFRPDSQRYFDYHHTANDVFENIHKRELELGAAGVTSLIYLIDKHGFE